MKEIYEKIHQLNDQAWSGRNQDVQHSLNLAQQVESMISDYPDVGILQLILSLRTQGYCFEHLSRYGDALTVTLKAMELASPLDDRRLIATIDTVLGNIYWRLSDYSSSLDHFMHGLRLIQIEPDPESEIFILQGLGALHHDMGDYEEALKYFKRSMEPVLADDVIGKAIGLNNIAYTLHEMQRDEEALPYALEALELLRSNAYSVGKLEALHTLGSIYLELGDIERASQCFEEGERAATHDENRLQKVNSLFGICEIHQNRGEFESAQGKLLQILEIAKEIRSPVSQCNAHEMLARVYKQMGNYQAALEHYELFHAMPIQIFDEQSERRLHNTQVLLEVETIRKQANLYRILAATDSLTGLLSRREFFELGAKIVKQSKNRRMPVSLLMVDLDYFKSINDQYGHALGDQVLALVAGILKSTLRQDDLAGRYGGDEFVILMPDIGLLSCQKIAVRCQKAIAEKVIEIDHHKLAMNISVGLAASESDSNLQLEDLIQQADQALLTAKKNRVHQSDSKETRE